MIIGMKKAVLLCLEKDKVNALEELRSLGLMQIEYAKAPDTESVSAHAKNVADCEKAQWLISGTSGKESKTKSSLSGRELVNRVNELLSEQSSTRKELDSLTRTEEKLSPWGILTRRLTL